MSNIFIFLSPTKTSFLPHLSDENPFNVGVVIDNKKNTAREKKHVLMKKFITTSCLPVERVLEKTFHINNIVLGRYRIKKRMISCLEKNISGRFKKILLIPSGEITFL